MKRTICATCRAKIGRISPSRYAAIYTDADGQPACYRHASHGEGTIAQEFMEGARA